MRSVATVPPRAGFRRRVRTDRGRPTILDRSSLHPEVQRNVFLRRNFSSSTLVRLLGDATLPEAETTRQDFAEKLSVWMGVFDAVTLHAAHQSLKTVAPAAAEPLARKLADLEAHFHQVRAVLAKAITASEGPGEGARKARHPQYQADPAPAPAPEATVDFAPYRQRYLDQQRTMELMIGPLRAHVREVVSAASPSLRQLAALDAVWERMLAPREQKLLATVPVLLKRRFERLRASQPREDMPVLWRQPGGWLDSFGKTLHEVLLAELNVRLEPVVGLMEAFSNEVKKYQ